MTGILKIVLSGVCATCTVCGIAQRMAAFKVEIPKAMPGLIIPLSVELPAISGLTENTCQLEEVTGKSRKPLPSQLNGARLTWLITAEGNDSFRQFELVKASREQAISPLKIEIDSALTIFSGDKALLRYEYRTVYPPAGIDTSYRRSGFIHPLRTPHGQELTRIQPADHYHHYGLWNPWTRTLFENDTIDFWNLDDKKGTVRFAKLLSRAAGPVYAEYSVRHEHLVLNGGVEKIALHEIQTVRIYRPLDSSAYILDFTSQLQCAGKSPLVLLTYRYGGFGWRATAYWNNQNSRILTSEDKDRGQADGSRARWTIVEGALPGNDRGGILLMSHPGNYNHPEPLRVWPENELGRGDVFINISPTKNKDWLLEPGRSYTLKYRLLVFNGTMEKAMAESAWQQFAFPARVKYSQPEKSGW